MRPAVVFFLFFSLAPLALAQNPAVTIAVDAAAGRRPIDPRIYGVAFASPSQLGDLNVPLNRWGGNATTRYNWTVNADNRGFDWYFQSIAYDSAVAGEGPDSFIRDSRLGGAEPMMTIPMVGWVAKVGPNRSKLASFSIAKYGAQTGNDWQWMPDAGNGIRTNGSFVVNDPNDASVPATAASQTGWFQHLVSRWGTAANGGLRYYILDNEPSIWHSTHRDVHPVGATMEEMRDKTIEYSRAIKSVDPSARVVGPEEFGWSGYLFSGYDLQWGGTHGWSHLPDRAAHDDWDYVPWLLKELRQNEAGGTRLLDVFTVHYYPQGGEFSNDVSTAMQLRRNRSTRSLWDPAYVDETWIADKVQLIPRLKGWAAAHYHADTPVGITEYNWGAEGHMNGATTQADVLGIFGRHGLDLAARWTTPDAGTPVYRAIQMYRNYDGQRGAFGDTSVAATGGNPDQLSAFAAVRSADGAMTVMVINKVLSGHTPVTLRFSSFQGGALAQAWQLRGTSPIQRLADVAVSSGVLSAAVPPQSLTLFVWPASAGTPAPTPGVPVSTGPTGTIGITMPTFTWNAASAATQYRLIVQNAADRTLVWQPTVNAADVCAGTACALQSAVILGKGSYVFWLRGVNSAGTGFKSANRAFTVNPAVPGVPVPLSPSGAAGTRTPVYTWKPSSNATHYVVRVQNLAGATIFAIPYAASNVCSGPTCAVNTGRVLTTGRRQWSVRAKNGNLAGAWSASLRFSTP